MCVCVCVCVCVCARFHLFRVCNKYKTTHICVSDLCIALVYFQSDTHLPTAPGVSAGSTLVEYINQTETH